MLGTENTAVNKMNVIPTILELPYSPTVVGLELHEA